MDCAYCGTVNEPGRKFCKECGSPLALPCAVCGAANSADSKFCGQCGSPLAGAAQAAVAARDATPAAAVPLATERRLVSVLFVDLVGFTGYAENADAEDVRAVLAQFYDIASDAVRCHGGVVEKFIGDAVMAVWGTPVAHEDDAERAVRAALEVVPDVAALGRTLQLPLQARAGVLTGEAAAAVGVVDQGIVTGDLVNTASRLQSAAEPGTVLVGERTFRAASRAVSFVPVDALTLKGKADPVAAWRALRVMSERGGSMRGSAPEPPFVGRDDDLRQVKDTVLTTGREQRPRLVQVTGVAGIGKSRLVWELQKYVDGLLEDVYWHQGRCLSYGEGVAFWAFAEMVRRRAGIAEGDDADTARERLAATLDRFVPDDDERRWIEPRLGHLLGLNAAPPGDREELFGAWRRFVERVAEVGTTVLVFEDLQWADPGLLDFVESLLRWSRESPVLVVALARPELLGRRPDWGNGLRNVVALHLEPLPDPAVVELVTGYVEGLPAAGIAQLVARAEGVPLYAVETVRMLADRGVLEQVGEVYRVVPGAVIGGELDIPETLHALVAARLDALPDAERTLLQDASVIGQRFTESGLGAVSGRTGDELEHLLRDLARKELLVQDIDPRSPERGQYGFVQAVIREVAHSTLSKAARRHKHLLAARYLESLDEPDIAGVVANHYLEAYRAEPGAADSEDIAQQATTWLHRAASRAQSLGSPAQALLYAEQALPLTDDTVDRAELLRLAATAAVRVGDLVRGRELIADAVSASIAAGQDDELGSFASDVLRPFFGRRADEDVRPLLDPVRERMAGRRGAAAAIVAGLVADFASHRGDGDDAASWSERSMELAEESDDPRALRAAASARSWVRFNEGRHWEAVLLARGVLELAQSAGSGLDVARAYTSLGVSLAEDDQRAAMQAFLDAAGAAAAIGARLLQMQGLANAAEAAVDTGSWDVADGALAEIAELSDTPNQELGRVFTAASLLAMRGDAAAGLSLIAELGPIAEITDSVQVQTWYLRATATSEVAAGDAASALRHARQAITLEPAGANAPNSAWAAIQAACALHDGQQVEEVLVATAGLRGRWVGQVRLCGHAMASALADGGEEAVTAVVEALDGWRRMDLPLDHATATTAAVWVTAAPVALGDHVDVARDTLDGLGAAGLLARLDDALAAARQGSGS
jgi:class 3 adenylate cyclase